jgi:probable rRNA maturation factor
MKFELDINNQTACALSKKYIETIVSETMAISKVKNSGILAISIALVPSREIQRVNRIYRKKDVVTDVLSFSDYGQKKSGPNYCELLICCAYVKKFAANQKIPFKKEMAYVIAHGLLHCLGWKHNKEMYAIQDKVCNSLRITRLDSRRRPLVDARRAN